MPPIECPTRTRSPSGVVASMTARRSLPSWSMVQRAESPDSETPWLRWS
uniref:Uncharacterized protein n=1 Tax=Janibacter limosus TaxID=53458 RepID=A0AC61U283_9MICO|nr:hypothetical protein [Janibacter limosus]